MSYLVVLCFRSLLVHSASWAGHVHVPLPVEQNFMCFHWKNIYWILRDLGMLYCRLCVLLARSKLCVGKLCDALLPKKIISKFLTLSETCVWFELFIATKVVEANCGFEFRDITCGITRRHSGQAPGEI